MPSGESHGHAHHRKRWHKDWRIWLSVFLMLAAIGAYVLTLDDSSVPWGGARSTPAAPPTAR